MRRRSFLRAATGTALCLPAAHANRFAIAQDASKSGWIDAHVHVWTPDTTQYPIQAPFTLADMAPKSFTPEQLFAHCKPEGVQRIVLIQMSFYRFDNRYMLDCMARHPGVFGGVAIVDENDSKVVDQMKSLAQKGVRGFRLYSDKEKVALWKNHLGMQSMWKYAADAGLAMCLLANPDALPGITEMVRVYSKTRVVIDHFARIGINGKVDSESLDQLCALAAYENVYVKTSAFYALGKKAAPYTDLQEMIRKLVGAFGASRLMWASDCPYQVEQGHTYANSIALIRDRLPFLTEADKNHMLRDTAAKIYFS